MKMLLIDYEGISCPIFNFFLKDKSSFIHNFIVNKTNVQDLSEFNSNSYYVDETQILKEYDIIFLFIDPIKLVDNHMYKKWLPQGNEVVYQDSGNIEKYKEKIKKLYNIINSIKYKKLVFIDTDDRARYKDSCFDWLKNECSLIPDAIFKTEYRRTYEYSYKNYPVKSFQFTTYSSNHVKEFYLNKNNDKNIHTRINKCVWSGSNNIRIDLGLRDEWVNRYHMIEGIKKYNTYLIEFYNLNRDEYINTFDGINKEKLQSLRKIIKEIVPNAKEVISYNMPAFKLNKIIVYYAAFKNHIGLYPASLAIEVFKEDLKPYKTSKGAIQFSLDKELPYNLIKKIIEYKVKSDK